MVLWVCSQDELSLQVQQLTTDSGQDEKLRLKQLSDERASKWPNTLSVSKLHEIDFEHFFISFHSQLGTKSTERES